MSADQLAVRGRETCGVQHYQVPTLLMRNRLIAIGRGSVGLLRGIAVQVDTAVLDIEGYLSRPAVESFWAVSPSQPRVD